MDQVKCVIINNNLQEVPSPKNYGLQLTISVLLPELGIVVPKIIHEPLWYERQYVLQVFSHKEKKVVPMKQQFDCIANLDTRKRINDLQLLASLALGFIDYSAYPKPKILEVISGRTFNAFLAEYREKPSLRRYYYDGSRSAEIYPEPFEIGYDTSDLETFLLGTNEG